MSIPTTIPALVLAITTARPKLRRNIEVLTNVVNTHKIMVSKTPSNIPRDAALYEQERSLQLRATAALKIIFTNMDDVALWDMITQSDISTFIAEVRAKVLSRWTATGKINGLLALHELTTIYAQADALIRLGGNNWRNPSYGSSSTKSPSEGYDLWINVNNAGPDGVGIKVTSAQIKGAMSK